MFNSSYAIRLRFKTGFDGYLIAFVSAASTYPAMLVLESNMHELELFVDADSKGVPEVGRPFGTSGLKPELTLRLRVHPCGSRNNRGADRNRTGPRSGMRYRNRRAGSTASFRQSHSSSSRRISSSAASIP